MAAKYTKVVIGIDQSYDNTGISIAADGKLLKVKSLDMHKLKTKTAKRCTLFEELTKVCSSVCPKAKEVVCIIERIRLHSQGFLSMDYVKSIGALNATIVDALEPFYVPVVSVDTRCWKSQVIGTSKPCDNKYGVPPEKWPTVKWCIEQGFRKQLLIPIEGRKEKGTFVHNGKKYMYNNDASDSAGIAMFGFVGDENKLKEEK